MADEIKIHYGSKEFLRKIKIARKSVPEMHLEFQVKLGLEALKRIVRGTPVDTGRARGNWQVRRRANEFAVLTYDQVGSTTIRDGVNVLDKLQKPYGIFYIFNNVSYIVELEEGSSRQAPNGMVGVTIPFLRRLARKAGFQKQFKFPKSTR